MNHQLIQTIKQICTKGITSITTPVYWNIPLFVLSILMLGGFDLLYYQHLYHEYKTGDILSGYAEMIFMAYLINVVCYLLRKTRIHLLLYVILFIVYIVNFYLRYSFGTDISPKILLLMFETNTKEVSGFFKTYMMTDGMLKTVGAFVIVLTMIIIGERFKKVISKRLDLPVVRCLLTVFLLTGVICGATAIGRYAGLIRCRNTYEAERWLMNIPFRYGMPMPNLCYSLNAIHLAGQDLDNMIAATENAIKDVSCENGDSLNIIVVIGESYNKHHASLYGYPLDTTPYQCEEQANDRLCAFNRVKSPHNMTSIVIKNVLCCNNVHEAERWYDFPYFPAIFKNAGYDVWLWDNQYKWNPDAAWAFTLNSVMFNERIQQLSYTAINDSGAPYDGGLITDFEKKTKGRLGKQNLIIFHLGGQHFLATTQYPHVPEYQVFTAKDVKDDAPYLNDESRQRIAEYANATRYNDAVIHQIMTMVKETNALLVYFPDHGEEIYDYRDFYGRQILSQDKITPELIRNQIEIPFIVWCSEKWKQSHKTEWETIMQAADREFTTDNVCHMLFHLAGIKTKSYQAERDLLSPEFIPQTKAYNMLSL